MSINKIIILLFIIILILIFFVNNIFYVNNIPYMTILELCEFNIKLFLIKLNGITYINKIGSYLNEYLNNDYLLLNLFNKLERKYNNIVMCYIIGSYKHYFILNKNLSTNILNDSPHLFSAGLLKSENFNLFMPNNVGISKCIKNKCPWKHRRIFNEKVLGTHYFNDYIKILPKIICNNLEKLLLNIEDFIKKGFNISSIFIYGMNKEKIIKEFIIKFFLKKKDIKNEKVFYEKYKDSLKDYTKTSLLKLSEKFKNDNQTVIDDQIPHWFGPFVFIISFLIPNLLCVILNFKDIYNKLLNEINNDNFDIFSKNSYLHYCVIEHIRLFNTININMPRTVNENMNYHNINFKKDDQIFMLFPSLLRDKNTYHNPNYYKPERWVHKTIDEQDLVFGIGPRQCPSIQITPILFKSIIYHLLKTYQYTDVYPKLKSKELYNINPYSIKLII